MISPRFLFVFVAVVAIAAVIIAAIRRGFKKGGWIKIALTILGALIGSVAGCVGMFFLYDAFPHHGCGVTRMGEAAALSLFVGAPVGLVTFSLIGLWLGSLLEHKAREKAATLEEEKKQGAANPPP